MTIYVDELVSYGQQAQPGAERYFGNGKQSCHMFCDGDLEELHAFAAKIGMRRSWFQGHNPRYPHYDLTPNKRSLAMRKGAVEVSAEEMIQICRDAHLGRQEAQTPLTGMV
jgi:hypothetical protein